MPLSLTLSGGGAATQTRTLQSGQLSIGRAPGNDWVLADPDRYLSKTHCVIAAQGGRYVLTDRSSNGIHVNGAAQPTQRDSETEIGDGDELRLGSYLIRLREVAADLLGADDAGDGLDDPFGRAPDPSFPYPTAAPPPTPSGRTDDPFDIGARAPPAADEDMFRGAPASVAWQGAARPDHAPGPLHAFAPKVVAPSFDDIDFDALIGDFPDASPPPQAPPPPPPVVAPPPPVSPSRAVAPPPPPPQIVAPPPVPPAQDGDARAALAAFLAGAGVPDLKLDADPQATLRAAGEVFRVLAAGLRDVLMSRAAIKGEMRVEQTMIGARDNNALKFSVTAEEAVAALLGGARPGYLPPLTAAKQGFADIKSHELAVMSGVQTALVALLKRFDPDALEKRLAPGGLGSVLPGARKARYWEEFRQTYAAISREAEDDFQAAFGQVFARAYTAQTRKE